MLVTHSKIYNIFVGEIKKYNILLVIIKILIKGQVRYITIREVIIINISEVELISTNEIEDWKKQCTKTLFNKCIKELSNYKKLTKIKLANLMLISCLYDSKEAIYEGRKKSIFNYNKVNSKEKVDFIIEYLVINNSFINFSESERKYLIEKKELSWLYDYYKKTNKFLIDRAIQLEKKRVYYKDNNTLFHSTISTDLITILDGLFLVLFNLNSKEKYLLKKRGLINYDSLFEKYSIEEISLGVSYLYKLYNENLSNLSKLSSKQESIIVNKKMIKDDSRILIDLIEKATKLQIIMEWEATIDFLGYQVEKQGEIYTISDIDNDFEKSKSLGYIRFNSQRYIFEKDASDNIDDSDVTIDKIVNEIYSRDLFYKQGKGNRERIMLILDKRLVELIAKTGGIDERNELAFFAKEWSLVQEEFEKKEIAENVYFVDLMKFIKPFRVIQKLFTKYIADTPNIRTNDIIGLGQFWMNEQMFYNILTVFLEKDKVQKIFEILTVNQKSEHLDLQYTPFLKFGTNIGVFVSLISANNILRNFVRQSFQNKNLFVTNNNGVDGLSKITSSAFLENGNFKVFENEIYKYNGYDYEIDVIAISENDIFIIECKNALLPTDIYEIRSSVDHLKKAQKQLDIHKNNFLDEEWVKRFCSKKSINLKGRNIHTLIIMGNRLFSGCKQFGHPIRPIFELDMVLNKGSIISDFAKYRIWTNEQFEVKDFVNYLNEELSFIREEHNSLESYELQHKVNGKVLKYKSYSLNQLEVIRKFNSKYLVDVIDRAVYEEIKNYTGYDYNKKE